MIVRNYIKCETCNEAHTLRIQVGHNSYQEHTFKCFNCGEDIVVGMHCYPETASTDVVTKENCFKSSEEGNVIYLSPEFPVSQESMNAEFAFPSIEHTRNLVAAQKKLGLLDDLKRGNEVDLHNFQDIPSLWGILKKGWSLTSRDQTDLAKKVFEQYKPIGFEEPRTLNYIAYDFCLSLLSPGQFSLFTDIADLTQEIKVAQKGQFLKFKNYYIENMKSENTERYFEVFSEYFKCFNEFSQTLMFHQHGIELPDNFFTTSSAFSKTKLFYGNAFEVLTTNISVLACLNNIYQGREYDEFQNMDLAKYLTINKANRSNPFKNTEKFNEISKCLESTMRNASHHGSVKLLHDGKHIEYRSGGTGEIRKITYKNYIDKCNKIMLSCSALFALEIAIGF